MVCEIFPTLCTLPNKYFAAFSLQSFCSWEMQKKHNMSVTVIDQTFLQNPHQLYSLSFFLIKDYLYVWDNDGISCEPQQKNSFYWHLTKKLYMTYCCWLPSWRPQSKHWVERLSKYNQHFDVASSMHQKKLFLHLMVMIFG